MNAGCNPTLSVNLRSLMTLYLPQKTNAQGFPSIPNRSIGSKDNRSPPMLRSKNTAGLPSVKDGIREMPLLVAVMVPLKWWLGLSCTTSWALVAIDKPKLIRIKQRILSMKVEVFLGNRDEYIILC